ncbi:MAG: PilC/PilY family type IV pilus protein [Desulfobacteraceae bacterium]|jgi:type IV pilus assembly protein PilY1|nr:PilC/PilY family type IV pilus protein [Desulfobacteraceae bacterium]
MQHLQQHNYSVAGFLQHFCIGLIRMFLSTILMAVFFSTPPVHGKMDIADEPMMAVIKPAPANIMFLLDDSGSMWFEVLTADYYEGRFPNPDEDESDGYGYIFDDDGHHAAEDVIRYMGPAGRKFWKSQFHEYNVIYYNPRVSYDPWPGYGDQSFPPADQEYPKRHPLKKDAGAIDLDGESFSVTLEIEALPDGILQVKHAHYFQKAENGDIYLVVLDGDDKKTKYYAITQVEGSGMAEIIKRVTSVAAPPGEIRVNGYDQARQNFSNWFTYHRRRGYMAKAAVAEVIKNLKGVRVGILSINGTAIVPLKPLGVWKEGIYYDETTTLLQELYNCGVGGETPLREGLQDIGNYYRSNSNHLTHFRGQSVTGSAPPYFPEAEGGACQQSIAIVMTDGYYSNSLNNLNVGNADGDNNSLYDDRCYADGLSETLADVAMHYYENDLSPDPEDAPAGGGLPDRVYNPELVYNPSPDKAPHQHMVTYAMAFGATGNLKPYDYEADPASLHYLKKKDKKNLTYGNYPNWPENLEAKSKETIDDLFHATANGRGSFLTANDSREMAKTLTELTSNVLDRTGSCSSITMSQNPRQGGGGDDILMFQAGYMTGDWSGDVRAYRIDSTTGELLGDGPAWSAAESLNLTPSNQRNILTYNGSFGIEFDENQLTDAQRTGLGPEYRDLIEYIKGNAIDGYRLRSTKLGDIVHSSPVLEDGVLYVGANDGMLHAFEIQSHRDGEIEGDEIFAYIPSIVIENLTALADPGYHHKYYVDLTPTVAKGKGLLGGDDFETILVGGLGKGGKGYFALDISDPGTMSAENVLWEFPNAVSQDDIDDIGFSFSRPLVVRTNSLADEESWVVIFGNGYNSANGRAALCLLNPKTGGIIKKMVADNPTIDSGNGLSSPIAVDVNADKKVDFVYAGDLKGNMWKFDLTSPNAAEWKVGYNDGTYDQPVFRAQGPDGTDQPITSKPEVMLHPDGHGLMVLFGTGQFLGNSDFTDCRTQSVYGIWDYGDRAYYPGEWGDYSNEDDREYLGTFTRGQLSNQPSNVTLLKQTSKHFTVLAGGESDESVPTNLRVMSTAQPVWKTVYDDDPKGGPNLPDLSDIGTSHSGWYYDLPLDGERIVNDVQLRDGKLAVICFRPDPDPCSDESSSFLMELNAFTGSGPASATFDINEDGVIDPADTVFAEYDTDSSPVRIPPAGIEMPGNLQPPISLRLNHLVEISYLTSSTGVVHLLKTPVVKQGVIYWKELEQ